MPGVTKPSSSPLSAQRPPVYLQAAAGNSFAAVGGACDQTNWGAAGGISNALCLQREFTEYFEEEAGKNSAMTQQKQTVWLWLCWKGSIYSSANKAFGWKEEDLEWLGMKFFPSGKVEKKDPSMEVRETEPKPSRRGGLRRKGCWGRQSSERPPVVCWGAQWSRGAKGG